MEDNMDDKYLDDVFREKLELTQHHDFDEAAWLDLESQLEEEPKRRVIGWRWLAAAGILLPILLSSVYFYYELRNTETQLAKLETKINKLLKRATPETTEKIVNSPLAANEEGTKQDVKNYNTTIATNSDSDHGIVNNQRQSAPLQITKEEYRKMSKKGSNFNLGQSNVTTTPNNRNSDIENTIINNTLNKENRKNKESTLITNANRIAANAIYLNSKNRVASNGFPVPKTPTMDYNGWIQKERILKVEESLWSQATAYVIPVGYEIGMTTQIGVQMPKAEKPLQVINETKPYVRSRGIEGAVNFGNGVDLTLGANFVNYSYQTSTIGQDFPSVEPNNIGDVFQNVAVTRDVVQTQVGLKYNFGDYEDVIAPFVELGGIAKRSVRQHHKFVYLPNRAGQESYAILPKPQTITENFGMNTAVLASGLKWNPNVRNKVLDNVVLQAEAFVQADFETPTPEWTAGVGISANYMF